MFREELVLRLERGHPFAEGAGRGVFPALETLAGEDRLGQHRFQLVVVAAELLEVRLQFVGFQDVVFGQPLGHVQGLRVGGLGFGHAALHILEELPGFRGHVQGGIGIKGRGVSVPGLVDVRELAGTVLASHLGAHESPQRLPDGVHFRTHGERLLYAGQVSRGDPGALGSEAGQLDEGRDAHRQGDGGGEQESSEKLDGELDVFHGPPGIM